MMNFYKLKEQMESLVTGDLALESLEKEEDRYLLEGIDPLDELRDKEESPQFIIYKDDDGDWGITDCKKKFDTYEEAETYIMRFLK